jgi:hypothetical protein
MEVGVVAQDLGSVEVPAKAKAIVLEVDAKAVEAAVGGSVIVRDEALALEPQSMPKS